MEAAKSPDGCEPALADERRGGVWLRVALGGDVSRIVWRLGWVGIRPELIDGRQKIMMRGMDGNNPNGHCDVRGVSLQKVV